jgi:ribosomal protein S18 acetylase RimI-like enzyme
MTTPFVRPYDPAQDFEGGLNVFLTTIAPTLNFEPARTIGSHIWYRPYVYLAPGSCFVLDDGTGRVVGYCIGAGDTASFATRWRSDFARSVSPALVPPPDATTGDAAMDDEGMRAFRRGVYEADCSMLLAWPEALEQFPAHLHVDIVPEFQRRGWGKVLIERFLEGVKGEGARGVHLGMMKANTGAKVFYERLGFRVCPVVMDGGESGEEGVNGVVLHLVKEL